MRKDLKQATFQEPGAEKKLRMVMKQKVWRSVRRFLKHICSAFRKFVIELDKIAVLIGDGFGERFFVGIHDGFSMGQETLS